MIENLIIRPIEMKDAKQFSENLYSRDTLEQAQEIIAENLEKAAQGQVLQIVAELDGEVVGTAILIRNTHVLMPHRAKVAGLVVKYELWGKGIARRLIEESKKRALEMGIKILEIGCRGGEPAEQVYPRLGFIEYSRLPGGIIEPWDDHKVFDEINFYLPLEKMEGQK